MRAAGCKIHFSVELGKKTCMDQAASKCRTGPQEIGYTAIKELAFKQFLSGFYK